MSVRTVPLRRVGHKGADHIAPGNTRESFDAALAQGVDMIEFDILPERWMDGDSDLFLAHDYGALAARQRFGLEEALAHLASPPFEAIELDVDLKGPGYELRVVEILRSYGLLDRVLISTQYKESLAIIRAAEPAVRIGWSVPKMRVDPFSRPWTLPVAVPIMLAYRRALPTRAARAIRDRRCDALMANWRLTTRALVRAVNRAGGDLYVWTVDDARIIKRFEDWGVTGVITNDPRLFRTDV
jgi:glycerophosphoryl diester phosphodiesterase